jgi:hypothetical protein
MLKLALHGGSPEEIVSGASFGTSIKMLTMHKLRGGDRVIESVVSVNRMDVDNGELLSSL